MNREYLRSAIFAVLFALGDPVLPEKIAEAIGISVSDTETMLSELSEDLDSSEAGICLLKLEGRYQLATRPKYGDIVARALDNRRNTPLSQAAMETLAIIAYNQPVSRAFIEEIRGVDSSSSINTLITKNLIVEGERLELPGHPLSFVTTDNFLRCFGLSSLDELPDTIEDTLESMLGEEEYKENEEE